MDREREVKIEKAVLVVYRKWKEICSTPAGAHPDEEIFAGFIENRLGLREARQVKLHMVKCASCAEALAMHVKARGEKEITAPKDSLEKLAGELKLKICNRVLEILLKAGDKAMELLRTNGCVLSGKELVPAERLRSGGSMAFKDEINIYRDFRGIRVEAKIVNENVWKFSLFILVKDKKTQPPIKNLRIALLKDGMELESYTADSGRVRFEQVFLGKYAIEIMKASEKLASISLDIRT